MTTSIADFANWMRLHLGKGELDGERLLPPALIGELHAPRVYVPSAISPMRSSATRTTALASSASAIVATGWSGTVAAGPAGIRR